MEKINPQASEEEKYRVPKPDWTDRMVAATKVGASALPVVGGPAVELINLLDKGMLLGKRMQKWYESLAEGLRNLEEKVDGLTPENLAANDAFVTTTLHATQAAIRSHQQDKLEALRNAVLNSALPTAPDEDMQLIFINLLDSMTASHIRILLFLADPRSYLKDVPVKESLRGMPLNRYIQKAFPDMKPSFYSLIIEQLKARGLTKVNMDAKAEKLFMNHATGLGWHLVQFIKSPIKKDDSA